MKDSHKTKLVRATVVQFFVLAIASTAHAIYMPADLQQVPIDTLVSNLKKQIESDPQNATLQMNLGRVLAMAYAKESTQARVVKKSPNEPWFGYDPTHLPFTHPKATRPRELSDKARKSLEAAIDHFQKAVELEDDNLTAKLSLAWAHDQAGHEMQALTGYREVIRRGWGKEKEMTHAGLGFHSIVKEAAMYLRQHLDKTADAGELADLDAKVDKVSRIARPVTPIAIPLGRSTGITAVEARDASVMFDADGSGSRRQWSWIRADAGWIVYDQKGTGQINSALQLFGSVTFWCFWADGYDALSALDTDQNGRLSGNELQHLAVWQDKNQNGVSDSREVQTLSSLGIAELSCQSSRLPDHPDQIQWNPHGVTFRDGSTVPSYDIILQPRKPTLPNQTPFAQ